MSTTVTLAKPDMGLGLAELEFAYANRLAAARKHFDDRGRVVGHFGNGLPVEIPMATGFMPVSIAPLPDRPTPDADPWVNPAYDPQLRVIFDQLLSGELTFLELAIQIRPVQPN